MNIYFQQLHKRTLYYSSILFFLFPVFFSCSFKFHWFIPYHLIQFPHYWHLGWRLQLKHWKTKSRFFFKKRAKYSHFRWRSRWGSWHFRRFKLTRCPMLGEDRLSLLTGSMKETCFSLNTQHFENLFSSGSLWWEEPMWFILTLLEPENAAVGPRETWRQTALS